MRWLPQLQTDAALVRRTLADDKDAFATLYDRHERKVFHLLRRLCADSALAEDLSQEAWIIAYESLGRWRGEGQLSSFLCGIAVRVFQNNLRRSPVPENLDDVDEAHLAAPLNESDGWERLSRQEADQALETAIAALPPEVRAVYVLVRVEGMRYREAASLLGVPLGTVQSRLSRATRLLLASLAPFLGDALEDTAVPASPATQGESHVKYAR